MFKIIKEHYQEFLDVEKAITSNEPHKCALALKGINNSDKLYYVVLEKAQKIIELDILIINKLKEIFHIAECNVKLIIITESYEENIFVHPDTIDRNFNPFKLFIAEYTPYQLSIILRKEYAYGSNQDFLSYFDIINQLLLPYTSKIFHYRTAFNKTYEHFLNLVTNTAHEKLFHFLTRELGNIELSLFQKFEPQKEFQQGLSTEAKILIISGFICSKNPPRLDNILLKGKKKIEKRRARQEYTNNLPPEKFSIQRLQAVYSIILHLHRDCTTKEILMIPIETSSFCALLNTLIQKKIFIIVTKKEALGCEKLMCKAEYDFCESLSGSIGIKLDEYVIDIY